MMEEIIQTDNRIMVTVEEAETMIMSNNLDFGIEEIPFTESIGRVLSEKIFAEKDSPPFDRITVDGIAIQYSSFSMGIRSFKLIGTMAAGGENISITESGESVEVMTGASLPGSADTIIRYEDVQIENGIATVLVDAIKEGQNIHRRGSDKKQGELVIDTGRIISPAVIAVLASNGVTRVKVKKLPKILVITTGDEIVEADTIPSPYQLRSSNKHVITMALQKYRIISESIHLTDDRQIILNELKRAFDEYDVIVVTGGVSKGKFDFVPDALTECGVKKLFHHVKQRPGKPFWFGVMGKKPVFAFPGNPVSVFMCMYRYLFPWIEKSLGINTAHVTAFLTEDVAFQPSLQFFLPVKISIAYGKVLATPVRTNGSGDFTNLLNADAFMELPLDKNNFTANEVYRIWPFEIIF
jgi:molybdopterin molybdotransferase